MEYRFRYQDDGVNAGPEKNLDPAKFAGARQAVVANEERLRLVELDSEVARIDERHVVVYLGEVAALLEFVQCGQHGSDDTARIYGDRGDQFLFVGWSLGPFQVALADQFGDFPLSMLFAGHFNDRPHLRAVVDELVPGGLADLNHTLGLVARALRSWPTVISALLMPKTGWSSCLPS